MKLRLEMTLRLHTNEMGMIKSQTQDICTKLMKTDADHTDVVNKLGQAFSNWNVKLTAIEANNERIKGDFQPLMELFASKLDELEADFATNMSSHVSAPGLHPKVDRHNIGSPAAPGTPPGQSNSWSPLNPQRDLTDMGTNPGRSPTRATHGLSRNKKLQQ